MSDANQSVPSSASVFQTHFGVPPGLQDAAADCKKWQSLCEELLQERQRLRDELAKSQRESAANLKALYALTRKEFHFTDEEIFAQIGKEPPLEQIIAELEQRLEKPA